MSGSDCVFCKIIAGDIPCIKIHEDDRTLAFMDINPGNPGHALTIPKFHAANVYDIPDDWIAATVITAKKVAKAIDKALKPDGLNLVQANGEGAAQSVQHFHIHILPRHLGDDMKINWGLTPGDIDEIQSIAKKINAALE